MLVKGNAIAKTLLNKIKLDLETHHDYIKPKLKIIQVGESVASRSYVNRKILTCNEIGIIVEVHRFDEDIQKNQITSLIQQLNQDQNVTGILVQLPLPQHLERHEIVQEIKIVKDVDCLNVQNMQRIIMYGELNPMLPCTPAAVLAILDHYQVNVMGMRVTVVGNSLLVGYPMQILMMKRNATVTVCHKMTVDLQQHIESADLVISAAGQRNLIKGEWIKQGAIVIDVGINKKDEEGRICGDVEFDSARQRASLITPVPGGVGPMTICMLMRNVFNAWCIQNQLPIYVNPNLNDNYLQNQY